jgi:predicted tellurium resistance membrane protein TerC
VLVVAGAARDHLAILIIGFALSIALIGSAAGYIAPLLHRHRRIAYAGSLVIVYVALEVIYRGTRKIWLFIPIHDIES